MHPLNKNNNYYSKNIAISSNVSNANCHTLTATGGRMNNNYNSKRSNMNMSTNNRPTLIKQDSSQSNASSDSSSNPWSTCSSSTPPVITSYNEKTVSLIRGQQGFGFVLRGAKVSTITGNMVSGANNGISLQYLDEVEEGGVARLAGLEKGDFLLNVNGVDVRLAPHEQVVNLIRESGDKVIMSVAAPVYLQQETEDKHQDEKRCEKRGKLQGSVNGHKPMNTDRIDDVDDLPPPPPPESDTNMDNSNTLRRSRSGPPPAPPRRDPTTSLTTTSNPSSNSQVIVNSCNGSSGPVVEHERGRDSSLPLPPPPPVLEMIQVQERKGVEQQLDNHSVSEVSGVSSPASTTASLESVIPNPLSSSSSTSAGKQVRVEKASQPPTPSTSTTTATTITTTPTRAAFSSSSSSSVNCGNSPSCNGSSSNSSCNNGSSIISGAIDGGSKVASIRPRGTRRMSGQELEHFISRQEDQQNQKEEASSLNIKISTATNNNKNNDNRNGSEKKHSKSGVTMSVNEDNTSHQELRRDSNPVLIPGSVETLTLKNGKIVTAAENSPSAAKRGPLPVPGRGSTLPRASPANTQVNNNSNINSKKLHREDSEYANFDEIKANPESCHRSGSLTLTSFKAPIPLPPGQVKPEMKPSLQRGKSVDETGKSAMKPVKSLAPLPTQQLQSVSVYTRQPTMDVMEERKLANQNKNNNNNSNNCSSGEVGKQPFIPDPDYSSSEDEEPDKSVNNQKTKKTGSVNPSTSSSSSKETMSTFKTLAAGDTSTLNKVQASIREFERRSSLETPAISQQATNGSNVTTTTTTTTTTSSSYSSSSSCVNGSMMQSMCASSGPGSMTSSSLLSSGSSSSSSHANNVMRVSRSCYEVESCCSEGKDSTSTSGISSDVDDSHPPLQQQSNYNNQVNGGQNRQIHPSASSLNRRSSGHLVVSEKIASLIAQTNLHVVSSASCSTSSSSSSTQTLPSSMKQHGSQSGGNQRRVSIADPPEQSPPPPSHSHGVKGVPTTAKTWSEISCQIKQVKGSPTGRTQKHHHHPVARSQSVGRPDATRSRLVNEVDTSTNLVPPPPQFAAATAGHRLQIQVRGDNQAVDVIRVVNPATGQTHVVQKPVVKVMQQQQQPHHVDSNRSTPLSSTGSSSMSMSETTKNNNNPNSAVARLGVQISSQQQLQQQHQAAYRMLTPQQQAQYNNYLQQRHQQQLQQQALGQQQFATLSRAYAAAGQQQQQQPNSGQQQQHQRLVSVAPSATNQCNIGSKSPQMQRAQFAVASNSMTQSLHQALPGQGSLVQSAQLYPTQHFATLSRAGQKALLSTTQGQQLTYSDLNRLSVPTKMLRQQSLEVGQQLQQQLQWMSPQQRQAVLQRLQNQGQKHSDVNGMAQYEQRQQHVSGKSQAPAPPSNCVRRQISFPRKSMVDWRPEDVGDWLKSIGMTDYPHSLDQLDGMKLLRLENNDLIGLGVKDAQHRVYLLEKVKQYLRYQQQHPPGH